MSLRLTNAVIAVASVGEPVEPVEAIEMTVGSTGSPTEAGSPTRKMSLRFFGKAYIVPRYFPP